MAGGSLGPWVVPAHPGELLLDVGAFGVRATLRVVEPDGSVRSEHEVIGAPFVLPHPLLPVTEIHAAVLDRTADGEENDPLIDALRSASPVPLKLRTTGPDGGRWLQDEYELGFAATETASMEVVLGYGRARPRRPGGGPAIELEPGRARLGAEWRQRTGADGFGNIEVSPPVAGHPLGRILYGVTGDDGPLPELIELLERQGVQSPMPLDTSWLCVGHVDELVAFVPDGRAPRGFRAFIPDPAGALALLDGLDPTAPIPWQGSRAGDSASHVHPRRVLGELQRDGAVRALNEEIAELHLPRLREQLVRTLGLLEAELVGLPVLYEDRATWDDGVCGASPVWPSPINMLAAWDGRSTVLFLPDPHLRARGAPVATDPVAASVASLLPPTARVVWVDTWEAYHLRGGEVHCATNVARRAPPDLAEIVHRLGSAP